MQLYGPLNSVVHPEIVEQWITELVPFVPTNDSEKNGWLFCLSQLARLSGLRAVDVSDSTRFRVLGVLENEPVPGSAWKRMVEEVVARKAKNNRGCSAKACRLDYDCQVDEIATHLPTPSLQGGG